jgi:fatty-acyl-CoA synthase
MFTVGHDGRRVSGETRRDPLWKLRATRSVSENTYGPRSGYGVPVPASVSRRSACGQSSCGRRYGCRHGGFDPLEALRLIEAIVTHAQFVQCSYVCFACRSGSSRYSLSAKCVLHAAPSSEIKRQMIDWFGPVIHEYYAGSERNGLVASAPPTWAARPGTVESSRLRQNSYRR